MTERGNGNSLAAKFLITYGAINNVIVVTVSGTGGSRVIFYYGFAIGMTECRNGNGLAAKLLITYGAINNVIVVTVSGTGGSRVIFYYGFTIGMTESGGFFRSCGNTAYGTRFVLHTLAFASRVSVNVPFAIGMTECRNGNGLAAKLLITYGAINNVIVVTVSGTSGSRVIFYYGFTFGMTESGGFFRSCSNTAYGTRFVLHTIAFASSVSVNDPLAIGMTERGNGNSLAAKLIITYRAINYVIVVTVSGTSRSCFVLFSHSASLMTERRSRNISLEVLDGNSSLSIGKDHAAEAGVIIICTTRGTGGSSTFCYSKNAIMI